jgi:hypothetical protein
VPNEVGKLRFVIANREVAMTAVTVYDIPDNPPDPEAAALELIVRLPADILRTAAFTTVLQDYCSVLHAEGAFAGLSWPDAKQIAAAVSFDVTQREDAADFIAGRARRVLGGTDGMVWRDRDGAARALNIAAKVLAL